MTARPTDVGPCVCCGQPAQVDDLVSRVKLCLACYGVGCDGKYECQRDVPPPRKSMADLDQRDHG